ncbi:MAG: hypothetical protein GEV11_29575 [Streptosporangiales bacterium]|nr:hypothetical protein [Streptosporangiales bacterium]
MGIGLGLFLVTLGAILKFAITGQVPGVDLEAIGVILMVAGGVAVVINLLLMLRRRDQPARGEEYHGER